jgi:hypothetical protein
VLANYDGTFILKRGRRSLTDVAQTAEVKYKV